jgi:hypothetical protein
MKAEFMFCNSCCRTKPAAEIACTRPDRTSICIPCLNKQVMIYPNKMVSGNQILKR